MRVRPDRLRRARDLRLATPHSGAFYLATPMCSQQTLQPGQSIFEAGAVVPPSELAAAQPVTDR